MENKAKEKAEGLVKSFGEPIKCKVTPKVSLPISMRIEQQLNCALIYVEETLKTLEFLLMDTYQGYYIKEIVKQRDFYKEVKEELNKMKKH